MTKHRMFNKNKEKLTHLQKSIVVATLLTDGWFELAPNQKSARIGLELSVKSLDLLERWQKLMEPFSSPSIQHFQRKPSPTITAGPSVRNRTFFHPEFLQFTEPFSHSFKKTPRGKSVKTVPPVSYLENYMNWEMFAMILMMDGSIKNQGRGMEIHLQSYSKEAQGRLCIALYHKLGMKCWPSRYVDSSRKGILNQDSYHITISGFNLQKIRKNVLPHMVNNSKYKVPFLSEKLVTNTASSPWIQWYKKAKNADWLETKDV